jgi:crotonobetainyl-CoA:carnitine CoA-transferase CaiB-like acyl-CoA transferase
VKLIEAEELENSAFTLGEDGVKTAAAVERALATRPRNRWLQLAEERGLPMGPVHGFDEAAADATFESAGLIEQSPCRTARRWPPSDRGTRHWVKLRNVPRRSWESTQRLFWPNSELGIRN